MFKITGLTLTANTNTTFEIDHSLYQLDIKPRSNADVYISFDDPNFYSESNYFTIPSGDSFSQTIPDSRRLAKNPILYLRCGSTIVVEIVQWFTERTS